MLENEKADRIAHYCESEYQAGTAATKPQSGHHCLLKATFQHTAAVCLHSQVHLVTNTDCNGADKVPEVHSDT